MTIAELIDELQKIEAIAGQETLEVFVVDDDHCYPLANVTVADQIDDPDDPPDMPTPPGTKGVVLTWL